MTEKRIIKGPVLLYRQRSCWVKIRRNQKSTSVQWDCGGIDVTAPASDTFNDRCKKARLIERVEAILDAHDCRDAWYGSISCRWSKVHRAKPKAGEEIFSLVVEIYAQAVADLPLGA